MISSQTGLFVIVDPEATHQVALVKAMLIAKLGNCHIHAFLCVHRDIKKSEGYSSRHDLKHHTLVESKQWLEKQLEPCRASGLSCSSEVIWNSKWYDSALRSIAQSDCDLVIKSSFHHSKLRRFYSATSDYTLMRHCAHPILFAHQTQEWQSDQLLACVDLESTDTQHARLNDVIVRNARALADIVGMDLNIAAAYENEIDAERLPLKGHGHEVTAGRLADMYEIEPQRVFLRQGAAVETIKAICDELDPSLMIIGTLARSGIRGKLIGNTAEKLLDLVEADLLTVN